MRKEAISRRKFLGTTGALAGGLLVAPTGLIGMPAILKHYNKPNSLIKGVQIGTITYSFRTMPDQSAEATLGYLLDCGISAVELMGEPAESFAGGPQNPVDFRQFYPLLMKQRRGTELSAEEGNHLAEMRAQLEAYNQELAAWRAGVSMDKFKELRKLYQAAGVKIYAFKPRAFGKENTDAEINFGMRAARALGASHVTLEHPDDAVHTKKLGMMAKKNKVKVAYHGHEQQTPTFWDIALEQSKYNAMNIDIGHYIAAGNEDPIGILREKNKRISSMHLKDRQTPENGKKNLPWGEGDTPIGQILQTMSREGFKFPATVELEYDIPAGSDAVKEVARCVEYCRQQLT